LLEDLVQAHIGVRPQYRLALAVWFGKSPSGDDQFLLELMTGVPIDHIAEDRLSLLWQTGSEGAPYANVRVTSVDYFTNLLQTHPDQTTAYREAYEVLYFDKKLLTPEIIEAFNVVTEPPGLIKGWYMPERQYEISDGVQSLFSSLSHAKPEVGLVKTEESGDFENCRGLLHVEVGGKWLPLSAEGIRSYSFYNDWQRGLHVHFLFEGGSIYQVLKFEVKTEPEYVGRLLGRTHDDRYPEVYLRAVHPAARPAA
jgi:hypothetical protein